MDHIVKVAGMFSPSLDENNLACDAVLRACCKGFNPNR